MCQNIEEISELLEHEKKRIEQEKKEKQALENEKKSRESKRKEKIEKAKKLSQRWAMYRWVTEYIDENYEKWEQEQEERDREAQEDLELWEQLNTGCILMKLGKYKVPTWVRKQPVRFEWCHLLPLPGPF